MNGVFPALIVIIGMVISVVSSAKKEKEKQAAEARRLEAAARRAATRQQLERTAAPSRPVTPAPAPARPAEMLPFRPAQAATPTVHAHVQPNCGTHDAPGSLGFTSTEGKDPCHEDQLTGIRDAAGPEQEKPALTFDWTGDAMVKAVVMQEILTRPSQRRAR